MRSNADRLFIGLVALVVGGLIGIYIGMLFISKYMVSEDSSNSFIRNGVEMDDDKFTLEERPIEVVGDGGKVGVGTMSIVTPKNTPVEPSEEPETGHEGEDEETPIEPVYTPATTSRTIRVTN